MHRTPWLATLARHFNELETTFALGRFGLAFAPPEAELKFDTAVDTVVEVAPDKDIAYAPARAAASVDAWSSRWQT